MADIHLNDLDKSIWSLWHCILNHNNQVIDKIKRTPVNIDEWFRQRDIYRNAETVSTFDLAFATFFLNRTNRSGIVKGGGVIGGIDQTGPYKIDCRYNFEELAKRISRIGKYAERIHLTNMDALDFMDEYDQRLPKQTLWFIDPPYYNKGAELYTSFYKKDDHLEVATTVSNLERHAVVTYDDADQIRHLYKNRRQYTFDISYSLAEKKRGTELFIASKGLRVPDSIRAKQVNRPHYRAA